MEPANGWALGVYLDGASGMTCPTCYGVPGGCSTCEGSGVVAAVAEPGAVTFFEAVELVYALQITGRPFHFLHGKPRLVEVGARVLKIAR